MFYWTLLLSGLMGVFSFHFKYGKEGSIDGYLLLLSLRLLRFIIGCPNWNFLGPSEQLLRELRERANGDRVRRGTVEHSSVESSTVQYNVYRCGSGRAPSSCRAAARTAPCGAPWTSGGCGVIWTNKTFSSYLLLHIYSFIYKTETKKIIVQCKEVKK